MKQLILLISFFVVSTLSAYAQYPGMDLYVKDLHGVGKPCKSYLDKKEGNVTLFVFWKTCCPANLSMIDSLIELKDDGEYSDKIKIVLVSVDDTKTSNRVLPVVKTKGWTEDVIMDSNMELARAMQVYIPPQWVAVDCDGNPIYRRKIMEGESDSEYYFNELIEHISKNIAL